MVQVYREKDLTSIGAFMLAAADDVAANDSVVKIVTAYTYATGKIERVPYVEILPMRTVLETLEGRIKEQQGKIYAESAMHITYVACSPGRVVQDAKYGVVLLGRAKEELEELGLNAILSKNNSPS
jgi:hypothetical protein